MGQGLDFEEEVKAADYKEDLINLLSSIELEENKQVVILIDEFPQTIQNMVEANSGDIRQAQHFLQSNREIRMNPEINSRVKFILTGSIRLNHTVAEIHSSAFVNDLNSVEVGALTYDEARQFLDELIEGKALFISAETCDYLLRKIEWLIPFHIQLAVQEIVLAVTSFKPSGTYSRNGVTRNEVTREDIDFGFEAIVQSRNNNHFDHYFSRLKRHFKKNEFTFSMELLNRLANSETIKRAEIFDLAVKNDLEEKWRNILEILVYDGYINNSGDKDIFRFNSPIVRMWWFRFMCK